MTSVQVWLIIGALLLMFALGWIFGQRWRGDHHPIMIQDVASLPQGVIDRCD